MTLDKFLRKHKREIDQTIRAQGGRGVLDNAERRLWVLNDEGLYLWARGLGALEDEGQQQQEEESCHDPR